MSAALSGFSFTEAALTYLETSVPQKVRGQIIDKIKSPAQNPHPPGCSKVKGVKDGELSIYRIRSGDYRVLYSVRPGPLIMVLDIGHRKDVYRRT